MGNNTLGHNFCITSFGESHGKHIGVIIDGCPSNFQLDLAQIQHELKRRRPGQSAITTDRDEKDIFEITSGVFDGKTTGAPICILIPNSNSNSKDYDALKDVYRPSHADYTYQQKYGHRDHTGGGRSSARVTAGWVAAGAIAKQILRNYFQIEIIGFVSQIYNIQASIPTNVTSTEIEKSIVCCPDATASQQMEAAILEAKNTGDSLGGKVSCVIQGCPVGVGNPVFAKLNAQLAHAMFSINAVKGFQIGSGFDSILHKGSELNDVFTTESDRVITKTNHSGGIQGGISNGMPIHFDVAFKPTATILRSQQTIDTSHEETTINPAGRHDPCVVPRAVPIVEAMAAIVLLDNLVHLCLPQSN